MSDIGFESLNLQKLLKQSNVSIVFAGSAGQGLKTLESLCANIFRQAGYFVFSTQELMSRIRGGTNSVEVRFSREEFFSFTKRIDLLIVLNKAAITHLTARITSHTIIISPFKSHQSRSNVFYFPLLDLVDRVGNEKYSNSIMLGVTCYLFNVDMSMLHSVFDQSFISTMKAKGTDTGNLLAAKEGFSTAKALWPTSVISFPMIEDKNFSKKYMLVNGARAIARGAIAGGCNFVSSYPMSPATSVLVALAQRSHRDGIGIEQTEDEIAAVNMAIGAWYAGGRALVTTSGGGFALMCEAISLAAMTETPLVVMVGQRPGPATGLPTRTEQSDLNLVLYAGHGEFPRFIFAPGTMQEAFLLTQHAFNVADQFQVPAFILADQYLLDSFYTIEPFDTTNNVPKMHVIKTDTGYKRYAFTEDGVSPRGIPGYGEGIVCADSDEHTEEGYITEDASVRIKMQNKRMQKLKGMREVAIKPTFYGQDDYDCLLICWGSNFYVVKEAVKYLKGIQSNRQFALLHFSQIYPLPINAGDYFKQAKQLVVIENNSTGQFAKLLESEFHIKMDQYILQYDGQPFAAETIIEALERGGK